MIYPYRNVHDRNRKNLRRESNGDDVERIDQRGYGRYPDRLRYDEPVFTRDWNPYGQYGRAPFRDIDAGDYGRGPNFERYPDQDMPYEYTQRRGQGWDRFYDENYDYNANYGHVGRDYPEMSTSGYGYRDWERTRRGRTPDEYELDQIRAGQHFQDQPESYSGLGPKGWQRSDDRIREEVNEALAAHRDIDPSDIDIQVENGDVTLEGTIRNRWMKRHMEDVVYSVFGVRDVNNYARIQHEESEAVDS